MKEGLWTPSTFCLHPFPCPLKISQQYIELDALVFLVLSLSLKSPLCLLIKLKDFESQEQVLETLVGGVLVWLDI